MLKQLILYSSAFAATAFAPTQRLVGRAFGASAGRTCVRALPFAALKIRVFILTGYKQAGGRFVAMPTLAVQSAATPRSGAENFCKALSSTVAGTLGKPESYVMVTFQKVDAMCYGGTADPAAFLYLSSLGSIDPDTNKATSAAVADILEAELGVPKGRYYINFFDSERSNMGYNGGTF